MENTFSNTHGAQVGKLVTPSNTADICLDDSALFKMDGDQRRARIYCLEGSLWITQEGDAQDYHLKAGEHMVISKRGLVLVQGQPEARARIAPRL